MSCVQIQKRGVPCDFCTKENSLFCCPRCKSAFYCSRDHFKSDWKIHKIKCSGYAERQQPPLTDQIFLGNSIFGGLGATNSAMNVNKMQSSQSELTLFIVKSLFLTGRCIVDNFNGNTLALKILDEVKALHQQGTFKDGELASKVNEHELEQSSPKKIREDKITWIASNDLTCPATCQHMKAVDKILYLCNKLLPNHNIRNRTDAMVACYPGNQTAYKRHVDNYDKDGRCITTLYYLNKGWNSEVNGGLLRMYPEGMEPVEIEPVLDRLLIFWSDKRNPHEVLPAHSTRYAITLWYFDTKEREQYLRRQQRTRVTHPKSHSK